MAPGTRERGRLGRSRMMVRVTPGASAGWQVFLPGRDGPVACQTLQEARRLAYLHGEDAHPCEIVVRDAYHRVVERKLIDD
jgi:hypothetical protein